MYARRPTPTTNRRRKNAKCADPRCTGIHSGRVPEEWCPAAREERLSKIRAGRAAQSSRVCADCGVSIYGLSGGTRHCDSCRPAHRRLYGIWSGIQQRCLNPNNPNYHSYGGRGITFHAPWVSDYEAFRSWILGNIGPRPDGHSLDRIDNDGNYEPGNLQWATQREQCLNRRTVQRLEKRIAELEADLRKLSLSQASDDSV